MILSRMVHTQKSVQQLVLRMYRNELNLGLNLIILYNFFEMLRKTHGYANSIQLSSGLHLKGSNIIITKWLIKFDKHKKPI